MQEVEAAVRERNLLAAGAPFLDECFQLFTTSYFLGTQ
jgi:hypothetical protein